MKLRFLGTSAGSPDPERASSSILVEGERGGLLIDVGEGASRRLQESDQWSQEVVSIILTHNHPDHIAGLPFLLFGWKGARRSLPVELFAPWQMMNDLPEFLGAIRLHPDRLPFPLLLQELKTGDFKTASGHELTAWHNNHLPVDEDGRDGSYSLALSSSKGKILFSSDLESFDTMFPYLAGAHTLILETAHINVRDAVRKGKASGVEKIYLTHIPRDETCDPVAGAIWVNDNDTIEIE
ncbi:MBL fold metallo-hydrolase [bacterium]|nr:MBL fold metallo-hydrolase [bacterium]